MAGRDLVSHLNSGTVQDTLLRLGGKLVVEAKDHNILDVLQPMNSDQKRARGRLEPLQRAHRLAHTQAMVLRDLGVTSSQIPPLASALDAMPMLRHLCISGATEFITHNRHASC